MNRHHEAGAARSLPGGSGNLPLAYSAKQLAQALGYADQASIYDLARRDPSFPKAVQLAAKSERRYLASDVQRWLESKRRADRDRAIAGVV